MQLTQFGLMCLSRLHASPAERHAQVSYADPDRRCAVNLEDGNAEAQQPELQLGHRLTLSATTCGRHAEIRSAEQAVQQWMAHTMQYSTDVQCEHGFAQRHFK
jgi:hypothetical protein